MKFVAMVTRILKPGKTYDDYRHAWFHTTGFGIPTTMYTIVDAFNSNKIISIGILDGELAELFQALEIDVKDRLSNPLDDVIESTIIRNFGVVVAVDDFSSNGQLTYSEPQVDGKVTNYEDITVALKTIADQIATASKNRDQLKAEK